MMLACGAAPAVFTIALWLVESAGDFTAGFKDGWNEGCTPCAKQTAVKPAAPSN